MHKWIVTLSSYYEAKDTSFAENVEEYVGSFKVNC
jgi:hypothetical protein